MEVHWPQRKHVNKSLHNSLVIGSLSSDLQPGTFRCSRKRCNTCPFIKNTTSISISPEARFVPRVVIGEKKHAWLFCFTFGEKTTRGYLASLLEKKTTRVFFKITTRGFFSKSEASYCEYHISSLYPLSFCVRIIQLSRFFQNSNL